MFDNNEKISENIFNVFKSEYENGILNFEGQFSLLRWIRENFPEKNYPYVYYEVRDSLVDKGYIEKKGNRYYLIKRDK